MWRFFEQVENTDSSDITAYIIAMMTIQKKLTDIYMQATHYETKPPAHMKRLLENLNAEQTQEIQYNKNEKWLNRESAT